jgi:hypothetical protein
VHYRAANYCVKYFFNKNNAFAYISIDSCCFLECHEDKTLLFNEMDNCTVETLTPALSLRERGEIHIEYFVGLKPDLLYL